jgi:hypothetical protein
MAKEMQTIFKLLPLILEIIMLKLMILREIMMMQ